MATASSEASSTSPRRLRRRALGPVVLLTLLILVLGYVRIGWDRMESACTSDRPGARQMSSVAFGWSWSPVGFTCAYEDGRSETSLWF